jgi:predicted DsbA family dithiol-disulfide isomerase
MKKCLESGKYDDRIASDMAIAQQIGFKGTPSFFVNTTNFAGAYSYKDMMPAVEEASEEILSIQDIPISVQKTALDKRSGFFDFFLEE